jgi:plasmid stability protein
LQLNVRINDQLHARLVETAAQRGRSLGALVRDLLYDGLERDPVRDEFEHALEDHERRLSRLESLARVD